jgi:hypothetical protein
VARRISMAARAELLGAIRERYRSGGWPEKSQILDEFVAVTGYHRKHAIRLLSATAAPAARRGRARCILWAGGVRGADRALGDL